MIFKQMSLEEAKAFYEELKEASENAKTATLLKIAIDDIWFFTNGLTTDYGKLKNKKNTRDDSRYIQLSVNI